MRDVEPKNAVAMVEGIQDLGLCSRGSGADNIRNVTGTPTAGIDPQELLDTRPYARDGISTSSTTARSTAFRANSTSATTAAA
jgi:sulfite reductase beta subunit-like hemoprotein